MNRRQFLAAALASVAPAFLTEAFAAELTDDLAALTAAFDAARAAGRPLFVIVRPADEAQLYDRGHAWGEVLMFGGDRVMALLGQVEVVVAGEDAVRAFAGAGERGANAEAWGWVLPAAGTGSWRRSFGVGNVVQEDTGLPWDSGGEWEIRSERNIDRRIAALTESIDRVLRGVVADPGDLVPADRAEAVARAVRTLREGVPANTHWANAGGCGTYVEGVETNVAYGCGMGSVPERSRRFLYFFDIAKYERGEVW